MTGPITVTVLREHRNAYGATELKKKGDVYECDAAHAAQLEASALVKFAKAAEAPAG